MATELNLPNDVIAGILSKAYETSAVDQLAGLHRTTSRRDQTALSVSHTDAAWHNPIATPKTTTDATITPVEVPMKTIYKMYDFHDFEAEDAPGLVQDIVDDLPGVIAESFDKSVFGTTLIATSPFAGFTTTAVEVDETAASWLAAFEAVDGRANGMILNSAYQGIFLEALTEGTNTNLLNVEAVDGMTVRGVKVYFRDLGSLVGVVGDWRQAVSAQYNGLETNKFLPESDREQRLLNAVSVYVGARKGFAVRDQAAFVPLSVAA